MCGLVVACKTRNFSDRYTDNRGVVAALLALVFAGVTTIPLAYILGEEKRVVVFYLKSIVILFTSLLSVSLLVVPKLLVASRAKGFAATPHTVSHRSAESTESHRSASHMAEAWASTEELEQEILELRELVTKQQSELSALRPGPVAGELELRSCGSALGAGLLHGGLVPPIEGTAPPAPSLPVEPELSEASAQPDEVAAAVSSGEAEAGARPGGGIIA